MNGRTPNRMIATIILLGVLGVVGMSICRQMQSRAQIRQISVQFVAAASSLNLIQLREYVSDDDKNMLRSSYIESAAKKLAPFKKRTNSKVEVAVNELKTDGDLAYAYLTSQTMLDDNEKIEEEWVLVCVREGGAWVVDLEETLKRGHCPIDKYVQFKGFRVK
ncbi:MAG: hypothetical protein ACOX3G_09840 [Armatimonadota bacterium]